MYKWYLKERTYWQVPGHLDFSVTGIKSFKNFKLDQEPDRWGDKLYVCLFVQSVSRLDASAFGLENRGQWLAIVT